MEQLLEAIWNPYLLLFFFATGLFLSIQSGFIQGNFPLWWKHTLGTREKRDLSQVTALLTALASTIGTGSIAGVATAIYLGGPGAIFWMWVSAFLGMMLSASEKILTIHYRTKEPQSKSSTSSQYLAGPMYYMERGLAWHGGAKFYAVACIFSAFVGGSVLQSSSIAQGVAELSSIPPFVTGIFLCILVYLALKGGFDTIGKVCTVLVPTMACVYLGAGVYCLAQEPFALWQSLELIVLSPWTPQASIGGAYGFYTALRYGMARGIFSNEAGLGASAMAHGNAEVQHPVEQGLWGMVEVFFATMVVCTLTALVILSSGIYNQQETLERIALGLPPEIPLGVPMTQAAFSVHLGQWGSGIVLGSLILFGFTSILGWNYYGQTSLHYLCPKGEKLYFIATLCCILWGSIGDTATVWQWVDWSIVFMAIPNLLALWYLAPTTMALLQEWKNKKHQKPSKH